MKKKNLFLVLVLTLAMCAGAVATTFADTSYSGTYNFDGKLESVDRAQGGVAGGAEAGASQEVQVEKVAKQFTKEVVEGKYKLTDTAELMGWVENKENMVIVDTMGAPFKSYEKNHLPGAIETSAPLYNKAWGEGCMSKTEFLNAVKKAVGTKTITKKTTHYWNSKTKKWVTKKPAAKYWKKCTVKKSKYYGKKSYVTTSKVSVVNKSKKIVVYCGFVGCGRSHEGAKVLVQNGYTNVYRYGGGISAWIDANGPMEPVADTNPDTDSDNQEQGSN